MVDINKIGEAKNYIERPGDTLLRNKGTKLIKAAGITDGESSKKASLAIAAAEGIYSAFKERKIRYDQGLDLPSRGTLAINYGGPWGSPDENTAFIPFYENPEIKEENNATYTTRRVFGRNAPLRNYVHSGPRIITLKVPVLLEHLRSFNYQRILENLDMHETIVKYVKAYEETILQELNEKAVRINEGVFNNLHREFESLVDKYARIKLTPQGIQDKYQQLFGGPQANTVYDLLNAHFVIMELIRSSVLTSNEEPWMKPPTVTLKYGLGWDKIQCIATNYSIDYDENAGFDVHTLLPRRMVYTLRLEEFAPLPSKRSGNGEFYEIKGYDALLDKVQDRDKQRKLNERARKINSYDPDTSFGANSIEALKQQYPGA